MSALLTRLTRQLASKGIKGASNMARGLLHKYGEATSSGVLTAKGRKRQALGKDGRAKDRAAKYSAGKSTDFKYNVKTNRATKK